MKKPSKKLMFKVLGVSLCALSIIGYRHYKKYEDINRVLDKHLILFYDKVKFENVGIGDIDVTDYSLNLNYDDDKTFTDNLVYLKDYENIRIKYYGLRVNDSVAEPLNDFFKKLREEVESDDTIPKLEIRRTYCDSKIHVDICPDTYDHKTGYDVDFQIMGYSRTDFTGHISGDYALNNLYKYGFTLRYTDQPWHFRYVGKLNAYLIKETHKTIEEYPSVFSKSYIYKVKNSNQYIYRTTVKSGKIKLPKNVDYEIINTSEAEYLVIFSV